MSQPNLIFVFADQWRRQAVGCMRDDPVQTPNIDRFAAQGLLLENALSCFPLCSPHRAALLTGRYPFKNGVVTNCRKGTDIALPADEICISDVLAGAGYQTGYIGKWHLDEPDANTGAAKTTGAGGWDGFTPPGSRRHGFEFWYSYNCHSRHLQPHYWRDTPEKITVNQWSPEHETDIAMEFLQRRDRTRPFALFISWNPPHTPFELVPEKYRASYAGRRLPLRPNQDPAVLAELAKQYARAGDSTRQGLENYGFDDMMRDYFAAVTGLDDQFGRLLAFLDAECLRDNTVVALSSDHGEMLGSHGLLHKNVWQEESVGIPFIIRWPGQVRRGRESALHNSVDTMPTLLGLLGLPVPAAVDGVNMSPLFRGQAQAVPEVAFLAGYRPAVPGEPRAKTLEQNGVDWRQTGWRAARDRRFTFVVDRGSLGDKYEMLLADNQADPCQLAPLRLGAAADNPDAARLHAALAAHLRGIGDPFRLSSGQG